METATLMVEGATASCMAAVFSNPFEVMKTRLQLQGELLKKGQYTVEYRGMMHGMNKIVRTEGLMALQKGIIASFAHQISQNGTRLGLYPQIKETCAWAVGGGPAGFWVCVIAAAIAGVLGAIVASPFYLMKTRLQAQANAGAVGHTVGVQHHYRGVVHGLTTIYSERGIQGLFHGTTAACWRTAVGSAAQLATYDTAKELAMNTLALPADDIRVHLPAAALAAAAITVTMNPLDVVTTRCYNNDRHAYGGGVMQALAQVVRVEGVEGLYKGSIALWARTAPQTVCTFIFLEQIRRLRAPVRPDVVLPLAAAEVVEEAGGI